jgi:LacI family transcriptional regulator
MVSVERATRIFTRIDELEQQMDQESELNDLPEKKLATMRDVARAAGVSVSTVSRVLDERLPTSRSASAENSPGGP